MTTTLPTAAVRVATDAESSALAAAVSVVVPCRNEARWIVAMLDAVARQDRLPDEIVVVDDASTDESRTLIEHWAARNPVPRVRIVAGHGRGAGAAMNRGIAQARGEIIVRLDGHSEPAPDYVRRAVELLDRPQAGVVGGLWTIEPGAPTRIGRAIAAVLAHPAASGGVAYRRAADSLRDVQPVDTVPFGCVRRSCWQDLRGFDEGLICNQDYDFNHRVRRSGLDVLLNARMRCVYRARPTLRALARQYYRYGFWKRQMLRKSPSAIRLRQVPPILVLPWAAATTALAAATGSGVAIAAAAAYPIVVAVGAAAAAAPRRDLTILPHAAAAIAAVHLSWSAGFWRGLLGRRPSP